jgi:hypothetical protein
MSYTIMCIMCVWLDGLCRLTLMTLLRGRSFGGVGAAAGGGPGGRAGGRMPRLLQQQKFPFG